MDNSDWGLLGIAVVGFICMGIIGYAHRHDNYSQMRKLSQETMLDSNELRHVAGER